ncbi:MAG: HD domain-containing protein [Clostridia bacterium]|nr:HD domain-containing protein [Clostridia bacterium]
MNRIILPDKICKAIDMLYAGGFSAYAVGGCVRDLLLGREPNDYDITSSSLPEETMEVFAKEYEVKPTGINHGTVTVIMDDEELEITTFRKEGPYSDHRHPDYVEFTTDIRDDLVRRDFTVNALAYNDREGLIDLFGGVNDLENRIIRTIGNAEQRFDEDALRIIRAVRFMSQLGFKSDENTGKAIHGMCGLLSEVAPERLNPEFTKLMLGNYIENIMWEFPDVFFTIIPELKPMYNCEQRTMYHQFDVWQHTIKVVAHTESDLELRLAALFHDVGKPEAKTTDKNGTNHFKGHMIHSVKSVDDVLSRFAYPADIRNSVHWLVLHHEEHMPLKPWQIKLLLNCSNRLLFRKLVMIQHADNQSKTDKVNSQRQNLYIEALAKADEIIRNDECYILKQMAVNGKDLAGLGITGKEISLVLDNLLLDVILGKIQNDRIALLKHAMKIASEIRSGNKEYHINLKEECAGFYYKYRNRV